MGMAECTPNFRASGERPDDDRPAAKLRAIGLLHRGVEGVDVDVEVDGLADHGYRASSPSRSSWITAESTPCTSMIGRIGG
jgi:hypothetical protein